MAHLISYNLSWLKKIKAADLKNNLKDPDFISLIDDEFQKLNKQAYHKIVGNNNNYLFYSGVESELFNNYRIKIKAIRAEIKANIESTTFPIYNNLVKIKCVQAPQHYKKFSLLAYLYVHKAPPDLNQLRRSNQSLVENHIFYLFPIEFGNFHKPKKQ